MHKSSYRIIAQDEYEERRRGEDKLAVIGNGVVVDPVALLKELDGLNERGISTDNLRISNRAQVILPYHLAQDEYEERRRGDNKIGTTKKVSDQLM